MKPRTALIALMAAATLAGTGPAASEGPPVLSFAGRVSPDASYRLRMDFTTTVNDRSCKFDDQITGMWAPLVEQHYYGAQIDGEAHSAKAPLSKPGPADHCGWTPKAVFLCVGPRNGSGEPNDCKPLLVARPTSNEDPQAFDVLCDPKSWVCVSPEGRDPVREAKDLNRSVVLNLVTSRLLPEPTLRAP